MEIREAAPVSRVETATQVIPPLDLMHRFVSDDLVEDGRRRLPVDAAQHQEAAVEPRRQQMAQIAVDRRHRRIAGCDQVPAHGNNFSGGAGRQIQAPEELQPRTFHGPLQGSDRSRAGPVEECLGGPCDLVSIRLHGARQELDERQPVRHRKRLVSLQDLARDGNAGSFAPARDQCRRQLVDVVLAAGPAQRPRQVLAALLGNGVQQLLEEGDVHSTSHETDRKHGLSGHSLHKNQAATEMQWLDDGRCSLLPGAPLLASARPEALAARRQACKAGPLEGMMTEVGFATIVTGQSSCRST